MPPRVPRRPPSRWVRLKGKIRRRYNELTPLRLRESVVRLRHEYHHPYIALLKLFFVDMQKPSWKIWEWSYDMTLPEPLAPKDIAGNEALYYKNHPRIWGLRYIPIWSYRDTPLRAIYRMYEVFMTREFVLLRLDVEYFCNHGEPKWALASIPDPCDPDPVRDAMLASIIEKLVVAFNWRLSLGSRRKGEYVERSIENPTPPYIPEVAPPWTALVPPIKEEWLRDLPADFVWDGGLFLGDG